MPRGGQHSPGRAAPPGSSPGSTQSSRSWRRWHREQRSPGRCRCRLWGGAKQAGAASPREQRVNEPAPFSPTGYFYPARLGFAPCFSTSPPPPLPSAAQPLAAPSPPSQCEHGPHASISFPCPLGPPGLGWRRGQLPTSTPPPRNVSSVPISWLLPSSPSPAAPAKRLGSSPVPLAKLSVHPAPLSPLPSLQAGHPVVEDAAPPPLSCSSSLSLAGPRPPLAHTRQLQRHHTRPAPPPLSLLRLHSVFNLALPLSSSLSFFILPVRRHTRVRGLPTASPSSPQRRLHPHCSQVSGVSIGACLRVLAVSVGVLCACVALPPRGQRCPGPCVPVLRLLSVCQFVPVPWLV